MTLPKVSVVMSTYNENIKELKDSITSILNQTYSNFDFIIVDDNPEYKKLKEYLLYINKKFKKVILLFNLKNLGAALSRNKGIKYADGKYIAIMDADDIANISRLYNQFRFLKKYKLDFVFPNYNTISINNHILNKSALNINSVVNQSKMFKILSCISNISINSGWFVKRCVFQKLNGYRSILVEDYDFIARAIILGYKVGFQSKILMSIRFRQNSIMRINMLDIYMTAKYIRKSLKEQNVFTITNLSNFLNSSFNKKDKKQFNNFILASHRLKYNFNFKNIFSFLFKFLTTKFAIEFVVKKLFNNLRIKAYLN